jgi:hypothetical protein
VKTLRADDGIEPGIWFDISTPQWNIVRLLGCFKALHGSHARKVRKTHEKLVSWLCPTQLEDFVGWAQEAYCVMRLGGGSEESVHEQTFRMRLPASKGTRRMCVAAVALSMPHGVLHNKNHVQLTVRRTNTALSL